MTARSNREDTDFQAQFKRVRAEMRILAGMIGQAGKDGFDKAGAAAKEKAEQAKTFAKERPEAAFGIAAALGIVAGWVLRRR